MFPPIELGDNATHAIAERRGAETQWVMMLLKAGVPANAVPDKETQHQVRWRAAAEHGTFCGMCGHDLEPSDPVWLHRTATEEFDEEMPRYHAFVSLPMCSRCHEHGRWWWLGKEMRCVVCDRPVWITRGVWLYNMRWGRTVACCGAHRREHRLARRRKPPVTPTCTVCGESFEAKRSTARFCSGRCRVAAHRAG